MCYTYRHDYGLTRDDSNPTCVSGMTEKERKLLWQVMAQIFDNDIAPYVELRGWDSYSDLPATKDYR